MAYVVKRFHEPDDPRNHKGAVQRALWRTVKQSFAESNISLNGRLVVVGAVGWMLHAWGNPHVLYEYSYVGTGSARIYTRCDYVGLDPFRTSGPYCPVVRWREWPKF